MMSERKQFDSMESAETEKQQTRETLFAVAQDFLSNGFNKNDFKELNDEQIAEKLQQEFQANIMAHYKDSGLADKVRLLISQEEKQPTGAPLDEQLLNLVTEESQGVQGWVHMLPKLRDQYPDAGLDCTMASALLHLALEEAGFSDVHTTGVQNHHVVFRALPDGSVKLYGPTDTETNDTTGKLEGYSKTFLPADIVSRQSVDEGHGRTGTAYQLSSAKVDKRGGFIKKDDAGQYTKTFYAYDPSTKMDIAVALGNLAEINADAERKIADPEYLPLDEEAYQHALLEFIVQNNSKDLNKTEVVAIIRNNKPELSEEIIHVAKEAFRSDRESPDPFDFLQGTGLEKKLSVKPTPDIRDFKDQERLNQADELCRKYPELKNLNYGKIKQQFKLFDSNRF